MVMPLQRRGPHLLCRECGRKSERIRISQKDTTVLDRPPHGCQGSVYSASYSTACMCMEVFTLCVCVSVCRCLCLSVCMHMCVANINGSVLNQTSISFVCSVMQLVQLNILCTHIIQFS